MRRIQAFCKLLDDASEYHTDSRGEAAQLRLKVFGEAAGRHPLVQQPDALFEHANAETRGQIAAGLGLSVEQMEEQLYADVMSFQRLKSFEGYPDAAVLLSRYNVAQLQGVFVSSREHDGGRKPGLQDDSALCEIGEAVA